MPANGGMNDRVIVKAVKDGRLDEADLDKVVLRLLKFAFECKESEVEDAPQNLEAHHELARRAAESGAILFKNEDKALPLKKEQNIAVIGALAKKLRYQGAGSSHINPPKTVSFLQALDNAGQPYEYAPTDHKRNPLHHAYAPRFYSSLQYAYDSPYHTCIHPIHIHRYAYAPADSTALTRICSGRNGRIPQ